MSYKIAIVGGCGHVGLALGIVLAEHKYPTFLYDINPQRVDLVNRSIMPHLEEEGEERLPGVIESKMLTAGTNPEKISEQDVVIFTTGTPIDEYLNPKIKDFFKVVDKILPFLKAEQTLIFRSTLFPGASKLLHEHLQSQNCPVSIAFCPERIIQGKGLVEIKKLPQLISAFDEKGLRVSREIFEKITGKETIDLEPVEAELAKLFCNTWRYVNFAISNQFYKIAHGAGADFVKIHKAVTHEYPRLKDFAGAGFAAGPCLFKDTMQLAAFSQNTFFLGHSAMLINEGMPAFVIELLKEKLSVPSFRGKDISILGMTFKSDNDDIRDSLSFKLKKLLEVQGARVLCHDPFLHQEDHPLLCLVEMEKALQADAVVIGTPHSIYKKTTFPSPEKIIDLWGILKR